MRTNLSGQGGGTNESTSASLRDHLLDGVFVFEEEKRSLGDNNNVGVPIVQIGCAHPTIVAHHQLCMGPRPEVDPHTVQQGVHTTDPCIRDHSTSPEQGGMCSPRAHPSSSTRHAPTQLPNEVVDRSLDLHLVENVRQDLHRSSSFGCDLRTGSIKVGFVGLDIVECAANILCGRGNPQ